MLVNKSSLFEQQAFRLILQYGVKPSWFNTSNAIPDKLNSQISRNLSGVKDLRNYLIDASPVGDSVVPELLLKALETYRKEGNICSVIYGFVLVYIL